MTADKKLSGEALRRGILKFIENTPEGVTSKMVADRFAMSTDRASAYLGVYLQRGYPLRREMIDDGTRRFRYFWVAPVVAPADTPTTAPAPVLPAPDTAYDRISRAIDALTEAIAEQVLSKVEQRITERIAESIERSIPSALRSAPKPRLPKVCIAGLHGHLHDIVRKEFGDQFDLVFVTPDEHENVWKSKASKCEVTFLMVDFISHKHSLALSAAHVEPVILHGAMNAVRDALTAYYLEKTA